MARILVVDDEASLRKVIKKYAEYKDHEVFEAENGLESVNFLKNHKDIDIVIMDIMMPVMDGYEALKNIRGFSNIPVIMLTAKGEEYDKVLGFELGVDDYVTKPFSNNEIILRIEAVLRRSGTNTNQKIANSYQNKDLLVDMDAYKVSIEGEDLNLSLKEYELLFYLINNKNIALSREKILSEVWGYDFYGDDRTLDTHIKTLRKALGAYKDLIVTVRGLGYRFDG